MNIKKYTIDGLDFQTLDGEIFGIGGTPEEVKILEAGVRFLEKDQLAKSVRLTTGALLERVK